MQTHGLLALLWNLAFHPPPQPGSEWLAPYYDWGAVPFDIAIIKPHHNCGLPALRELWTQKHTAGSNVVKVKSPDLDFWPGKASAPIRPTLVMAKNFLPPPGALEYHKSPCSDRQLTFSELT